MSLRTGKEAIAWAREQHESRDQDWTGYCLKFTRLCFNVSSRYPSAESAWFNTKKRHTSWPPPKGVPVWWTNGRYGHVVISAGDGYCWSNDYLRTGYVDKVKIQSITAGWGQRYRGWTEDINDVVVWEKPPPRLDVSDIAEAARKEEKVRYGRLLKRAVAAEVGKGNMYLHNGELGTAFRVQYREVQEKYLKAKGERVTPQKADGIPGAGSLAWLGNRHGFKIKD